MIPVKGTVRVLPTSVSTKLPTNAPAVGVMVTFHFVIFAGVVTGAITLTTLVVALSQRVVGRSANDALLMGMRLCLAVN